MSGGGGGGEVAELVAELRQASSRVAAKLGERDDEVETLQRSNAALKSRVAELERQLQEGALSTSSSFSSSSSTAAASAAARLSAQVPIRTLGHSPRGDRRTMLRGEGDQQRARLRSSSDDGSSLLRYSSHSSFRRMCSYTSGDEEGEEGNGSTGGEGGGLTSPRSLHGDVSSPFPGGASSARQRDDAEQRKQALLSQFQLGSSREVNMHMEPVDKGVDSLESFPIASPRANPTERSGYRLLTCNDDQCHIQEIVSGLIRIPHLTKMLVKCKWLSAPRTVLIIKKPNEVDCTRMMLKAARLFAEQGLAVVVEKVVHESFPTTDPGQPLEHQQQHALLEQLRAVESVAGATDAQIAELPIDFCVCIGGDGTIIWLSHLFPKGCPLVVSVAMGSLGFLSTFTVDASTEALNSVLSKSMLLTLRSRLDVQIFRDGQKEPTEISTVLNEVVIDRGPNSSIVNLDLFIGNSMQEPITHVQGDGIIISTPTGSTAYSLSAGGSMIHPSIPCVVVTPICPHSLSFRPIVVSDTTSVRLRVSESARTSAFVSFDGRTPVELRKGDEISINVSEFPVPCICARGENEDWFTAIKSGFMWNERTVQKKLSWAAEQVSAL